MNKVKEYRNSLRCSTIFSIIYVVLFWVIEYADLPEVVEYYMEYVLFTVCTILLVILWIMTLRCYLSMEFEMLREQDGLSRRLAIFFSVIPVTIFCVVSFCYFDAFLSYLTYHWTYIGKLWDCVAIKLGLVMGWLVGWCISVRTKRIFLQKNTSYHLKNYMI